MIADGPPAAFVGHNYTPGETADMIAASLNAPVSFPIELTPAELARLEGAGPKRPAPELLRAVRQHFKAAVRRSKFTHKLTRKAAKRKADRHD
jgi:hypothetical protein